MDIELHLFNAEVNFKCTILTFGDKLSRTLENERHGCCSGEPGHLTMLSPCRLQSLCFSAGPMGVDYQNSTKLSVKVSVFPKFVSGPRLFVNSPF